MRDSWKKPRRSQHSLDGEDQSGCGEGTGRAYHRSGGSFDGDLGEWKGRVRQL